MKFVTSREVRNNPSQFRKDVERDDVVLTVGGKPFAVAVGIDEDEIEETLDMLRRLRALRAMTRMQRKADERGVSGMSPEEIDEEIREALKSRRRG
jgi:antitoxin (DNA-binding transcriptional repressor) of toxin-antitoxin stability system